MYFMMKENGKEQHLFEIQNVSNVINVISVTFDQFNVSFLYKSIKFFKKVNF